MPKKANIVVFKKKNILQEHKKILFILVVILLVIPVTVFLALSRQSFINFADAGSTIDSIEISPGEIVIDLKDDPLALSALAYDVFKGPIYYLDINYAWSMSSTNTVGTLTKTNGEVSQFIPLVFGCGQLSVTASWSEEVVTKSIQVSVKDGENIPNCTGVTSPTPMDEPAYLEFTSVKLHGIGFGGDNTNASIAGNLNPQRNERDLIVYLEDSSGNSISAGVGQVIYSSSSGVFTGNISLSDTVSSGNYLLKIKSDQYLRKQIGGIVSVVKGESAKVPEFSLITGDVDNNNKVDINDYNLLIDCYSDLLPARNCNDDNKKLMADLSDDGYVNADDYNLFIRELSVASGD
jgi:hypothetical protein